MSSDRKQAMKMLADFSTIGMSVAFSVFIGVWIGWLLDHKVFNGRTEPWFTLIFLGLGVAAAFRNLFHMARRKDL
ncbi:MAG: F0F1-ATPase subunit [Deltaproteobacteria bacterium CG23_combo_of_CG06-09_8_20_14_all_60_8]|nr:MAG: F0F1-ATPase subunit [Deltaproteobacteria bacterium CG23_combo_of_CG06-09_8_20_14_all_60_8]